MITASLILSGTFLVVAVVGYLAYRPTVLRSRLRERFVVTLKSGASFEGVLYATDGQSWVLRDARALGAGERGTNVPVDGEVILRTADIDFAQRP